MSLKHFARAAPGCECVMPSRLLARDSKSPAGSWGMSRLPARDSKSLAGSWGMSRFLARDSKSLAGSWGMSLKHFARAAPGCECVMPSRLLARDSKSPAGSWGMSRLLARDSKSPAGSWGMSLKHFARAAPGCECVMPSRFLARDSKSLAGSWGMSRFLARDSSRWREAGACPLSTSPLKRSPGRSPAATRITHRAAPGCECVMPSRLPTRDFKSPAGSWDVS